ncbi:hypothetical protein [Paenibacillus whitsoniae]|uniref:Uncharacterized protein n=1 Tax=Paenibacillus whitsoniae TaxID=2496558 RepID=A0A430J7Q5_9BACL|nr:hypothetical protein [Paenibacillus whitsoniae]RTE05507.1 hypothetical protein EJQ19_25130 [Paenibacillus whitsoniae]
MSDKAVKIIESVLKTIIEQRKRDISKMMLYVYPGSPLLEEGYVKTKYGVLVVTENPWATKGTAYIREETSKGSAFAWVSRRQVTK